MKRFFNIFIIILFYLLVGIKTEDQVKLENEINLDFNYPESNNSQMIPLHDSNFDSVIQNGNNNRWFIFFYAESSKYSKNVKAYVDTIINDKRYISINNLRFASVDIDYSLRLRIRFNITGIPYIIMVEDDKMLELNFIPNEQLYIKFFEIKDINEEKNVIDFKHALSLHGFIKGLFMQSMTYMAKHINSLLEKNKIKYRFTPISFFLYTIFTISFIMVIIIIGIYKCFCGVKGHQTIDKNELKEESEDKIKENESNINNKDMNNINNEEVKKKIIEENKEKEMKDKINKKENNNNNKKDEIKKKEKKEKKE